VRREVGHGSDIGRLCEWRHIAKDHVLDHALAQWRHRLRHGILPSIGLLEDAICVSSVLCRPHHRRASDRSLAPASVTAHLTGYIRVNANSLDQTKSLVTGNPHFEAGGTVEIRELPRTD
jgi:hypothetical protein